MDESMSRAAEAAGSGCAAATLDVPGLASGPEPQRTRDEDLAFLETLFAHDPGLTDDWAAQDAAWAGDDAAAARQDRWLEAARRRDRLDADPGVASLRAVEEALDGRPAPALPPDPAHRAETDPTTDPLGDDLVSAFAGSRRLECYALWLQVRAAAGILSRRSGRTPTLRPRRHATRFTWDTDDGTAVDEVVAETALAAGISMHRAGGITDAARALIVDGRLPATAALLSRGLLDWPRIHVLMTRTQDLSPDAAQAVETLVYATRDILTATLPRFTATVDHALLVVDAEAAAERARAKVRSRRIGLQALPDGQALLTAVGPATALTATWTALDQGARSLRRSGDPRTLEQLRHDLLVTRCTSGEVGTRDDARDGAAPVSSTGSDSPAGPDARAQDLVDGDRAQWFTTGLAEGRTSTVGNEATTTGIRALVHVTITAETLMALARTADDGAAGTPRGARPKGSDPRGTAYLRGYGPIPAAAVTDLLQHGLFRCLVVDGTHGTVLGVGRSTFTPGYPPGTRLRSLLDEVAPGCDVPGCTIPARSCDLDHRTAYAHGGATCECNVRPLCRTHHRLKTARRIRAVPSTDPDDPPGTWVWVTRTGRRYTAHQHIPLPHAFEAGAELLKDHPPNKGQAGQPDGTPPRRATEPADPHVDDATSASPDDAPPF